MDVRIIMEGERRGKDWRKCNQAMRKRERYAKVWE